MIFRRKYSNEKQNHCKNLQEKIPTKKTKMNKFSQQKPLDIPSEFVHNHEELEHNESQIVKTTEESRITAEIENVTQPCLIIIITIQPHTTIIIRNV